MSESFAQLFEESLQNTVMQAGSIVYGKVVAINDDYVTVDVGLKSEGIIPTDQFRDDNGEVNLNVGEEVEVALDAVEDGFGETRLSREKALRARAWKLFDKA